jgi:hypothetical protein
MIMGTFAGGRGDSAVCVGWAAHLITRIVIYVTLLMIAPQVTRRLQAEQLTF